MIRTGVFGVGYLGRFHAQKYAQMDGVELVGVMDIEPARAEAVAREVGTKAYSRPEELIPQLEAASVVVPTIHHHQVTRELLESGVHCLVEKPITTTLEEAEDLIDLARSKGLILQVGHLERFNPAVRVLTSEVTVPLFIEAHRLSPFRPRATDVDVVLDLMIHDIDITLALVKSPLKELRAAGVPVLTPRIDIANARLIFENGCTANLTASRISLQSMRRIRVFQPGGYLSADCTERTSLTVKRDASRLHEPDPMAAIIPNVQRHGDTDVLMEELASFIDVVRSGGAPIVSGEAGREALAVALEINSQIKAHIDAFPCDIIH